MVFSGLGKVEDSSKTDETVLPKTHPGESESGSEGKSLAVYFQVVTNGPEFRDTAWLEAGKTIRQFEKV